MQDLKYDNCAVPEDWVDEYQYTPEGGNNNAPPGYDYSTSKTALRYNTMRDALLKQNRTIQYSLCAWGHAHVEQWGNHTGHSWRMWGDIYPEWAGQYQWSWGLMPILNQASFHWNTTDFWGHNDWDMLEVGNGNLTHEENRSHFALWAALKSPLIIGTPLDDISRPVLEILSNRELLEFNQDDVYGASAFPYKWGVNEHGTSNMTHPAEYWTGTSVKGIHVFMLNTLEEEVVKRAVYSEIPGLKGDEEYLVHDMWTGKDLGVFRGSFNISVKRHDTAALRFTNVDGRSPPPRLRSLEG
jgi:alpha-galactosidase